MPEWIEATLRALAIALAGAGLAAIGSIFFSPRRLRRDLVDDAAMLPSLPPLAKSRLSDHVSRRTTTLIAAERYPAIVPSDVLRSALVIGIVALTIWQGVLLRDGEAGTWGVADFGFTAIGYYLIASQWYWVHIGVVWRAKDREELLESWGAAADPEASDFFGDARVLTSAAVGAFILAGVPGWFTLVALSPVGGPDWVPSIVILAWVLVGLVVLRTFMNDAVTRPLSRVARKERDRDQYREAEARRAKKKRDKKAKRDSGATAEANVSDKG